MFSMRRSFLKRLPFLGALPAAAASATAPASGTLLERLLARLDSLEIADSHEHFFDESLRVSQRMDLFSLLRDGYVASDLASAGLPAASARIVRDEKASDAERWRALEPYWKVIRFTGYSQALRLAVRDLYGIEEISASTIAKINAAIQARNKPGVYRYLLKKRAKIAFCVEDDMCGGCVRMQHLRENADLFVLARRFDKFVIPAARQDLEQLENMTGASITSLRGLEQAVERDFQANLAAGMKVVKVALAYMRELLFQEVDQAEAERDFETMARGNGPLPEGFRRAVVRPYRRMEDHMFHHVMKLADAHHLPVQIHTGLFAGNGFIRNSNPTLLTNLFYLYPRLQFDLFHLGYPYQEELSVLAKSFPNVHADFCWAYVVSPTASRRALEVFLDTVPANKILGFGGDFKQPELSYAHAKIARRCLAQVLAGKVQSGDCNEDEALALGRMLLYENAARLFLRPPAGQPDLHATPLGPAA